MRAPARALWIAVALGGGCGDDLATAVGQEDSTSTGDATATTTGGPDVGDDSGAPVVCTPGHVVCGSGEVLTCRADGSAWDSAVCPAEQVCLDGACVATGLMVTTEVLPAATLGFDYAAPLQAAGGTPPYAWSVATGEVPPGLTLAADGSLTGMPELPGDYVFGAAVSDAEGAMADRDFSLTVHPEPLTIITLPDLGDFDEGEPMTVPLVALGGVPPYGWFLIDGELPEGLIVDAAGAVTGIPLAPGPFDFRVRIVDAQQPPGYDEQDFSLQIDLRPLSIVGETEYDLFAFKVIVLPLLTIIPGVPVPYSTDLMADGGLAPYGWSEQPLPGGLQGIITQAGIPDGLTLDPGGTLSGAVTNADQVITVPLILAGIDLTGFFFYAEVADSQNPAETDTALFVIPTLPIGA